MDQSRDQQRCGVKGLAGLTMEKSGVRSTRLGALTLIEVLVVIAIISLLASLLLPGLWSARQQARAVVCRSNLQQIVMSNIYYSQDHKGTLVPGAAEFVKNLERWHGRRDHVSEAFEPSRGALVDYLGPEERIRQCPVFPVTELSSSNAAFERGNGGYGYNNRYVGVRGRSRSDGAFVVDNDRAGAPIDRIRRAGETVMFTDSGFATRVLIEYSFAEPRFNPEYAGWRNDPSIHFRHRDLANVAWVDGHADAHSRTFSWKSGFYRGADPDRWSIGWFGDVDDNSLFDLD